MDIQVDSYEKLRSAVLNRMQVQCMYKGYERWICPHVIGAKNGRLKVLGFQFAGGSSSGLPTGGQWRCMFVDEIECVSTHSGTWHTSSNHSMPQTCVDEIHAEVDY